MPKNSRFINLLFYLINVCYNIYNRGVNVLVKNIFKVITVFGLSLISIILIFLTYFLFKERQVSNYGSYGPVAFINLDYKEINNVDDGYLLVTDYDNNRLIINDKNELIVKLDDSSFKYFAYEENYFILSNSDDACIIYDINGEKVHENEYFVNVRKDQITNKIYFSYSVYDEDKDIEIVHLLNNKFEEIFNFELDYESSFQIINDTFYLGDTIYNSDFKKVGTFFDVMFLGDYLIIENDIIEVINIKTNDQIVYEKIEYLYDIIALTKKDETLLIDYDGNILSDNDFRRKLDDNHYMNYSSCKIGATLENKKGEVIYSDCSSDYEISEEDSTVFIAYKHDCEEYGYDSNNCFQEYTSTIVFSDGKKEVVNGYSEIVGNYIYSSYYDEKNEETKEIIYDFNGNIKYDNYNYLSKLNENYYVYDDNNYLLLNNELEVIETYDNIYCDDNDVCIFKKDNKVGLFYNDDWVVEMGNYYNIVNNYNNTFTLENINGYSLLTFSDSGKFINKNKINNFKNEYLKINVNDYLARYALDEKLINDNLELFKKYAYVVSKNPNLDEFDDYIFNLFKVLAYNKHLLIEDKFFYSLKHLKIDSVAESQCSGENVAGCYIDTDKQIEYMEEYIGKPFLEHVLYHELFHFLDFSLNTYEQENFYTCNDKYVSSLEYEKLSEKEKEKECCTYYGAIDTQFIREGGAELFSAKYFFDYQSETYPKYVEIINDLSVIYGEDRIEEIFYMGNTDYEFYKLMVLENGMDSKDYEFFVSYANDDTNDIDSSKYLDILVDLYNSTGRDIDSDNQFKYLLSKKLQYSFYKMNKEDKNYEFYNELSDYRIKIENTIEQYILKDNQGVAYYSSPRYFYKEGNIYFIFSVSLDDEPYTTYLISFDFENEVVKNVETIETSLSS